MARRTSALTDTSPSRFTEFSVCHGRHHQHAGQQGCQQFPGVLRTLRSRKERARRHQYDHSAQRPYGRHESPTAVVEKSPCQQWHDEVNDRTDSRIRGEGGRAALLVRHPGTEKGERDHDEPRGSDALEHEAGHRNSHDRGHRDHGISDREEDSAPGDETTFSPAATENACEEDDEQSSNAGKFAQQRALLLACSESLQHRHDHEVVAGRNRAGRAHHDADAREQASLFAVEQITSRRLGGATRVPEDETASSHDAPPPSCGRTGGPAQQRPSLTRSGAHVATIPAVQTCPHRFSSIRRQPPTVVSPRTVSGCGAGASPARRTRRPSASSAS